MNFVERFSFRRRPALASQACGAERRRSTLCNTDSLLKIERFHTHNFWIGKTKRNRHVRKVAQNSEHRLQNCEATETQGGDRVRRRKPGESRE